MTPLTRELVVYSLQIGLLVSACAAAMRATAFPLPQARLACWRLLLATCLLLPLWPAHVANVTIPAFTQSPGQMPARVVAAAPPLPGAPSPRPSWTLSMLFNLLPLLAAAGAVARGGWLAAGLVSLKRLASSAGSAIETPALVELHQRIGSPATMRWHDGIEQPVAFGWRQPTVLLPASLEDRPIDVQCAALSHELLHVSRGDWLTGILEQVVLCCFWFHPAVWWAVDQMELHREQVVDDLSIAAVGSRKDYLRALLEFADKPAPAVALAFGHRQLARRIQHLSREIVMTRSRFAVSAAAFTLVMSVSTFAVASALPLRTEVRYHVVAARAFDARPPAAASVPVAMAEPAVQRVDVGDPAVNDQQDPLALALQDPANDLSANLRSVQAEMPALLANLRAAEAARLAAPRAAYPDQALKYGVGATITMAATVTSAGQVVDIAPAMWSLTVTRDVTDVGYWATTPQKAFFDACTEALQNWRPAPLSDESTIKATFTFVPGVTLVTVGVERRAEDSTLISSQHGGSGRAPASVADPGAIARVGGDTRTPRKTLNVDPLYPPVARDAGISGIVIIEVTIAADGTVSEARIVRSVPLLDEAALDAVRQWTYEPTIKDGAPVPVRMTVTVNFSLRR